MLYSYAISKIRDIGWFIKKSYQRKGYATEAEVLEAYEAQSQKVASVYSLAGSMQGWTPGATPFYVTSDTDVVELEIDLSAGTHEFKVAKDGKWDVSYGYSGTINDATNDAWVSFNGSSNAKIQATGGTYLIQFKISTKQIKVIKIA